MKEHSINFNDEMVRAILDSRKTQTRRVIKRQPLETNIDTIPIFGTWGIEWDGEQSLGAIKYPYGQVGDRLWVKETWACSPVDGRFIYRATDSDWEGCWKPSIHMKREASRITLEITGVRVERLQDISEDDVLAEGVVPTYLNGNFDSDRVFLGRTDFQKLWESIYAKKHPWNTNPWVWVITFKPLTDNV